MNTTNPLLSASPVINRSLSRLKGVIFDIKGTCQTSELAKPEYSLLDPPQASLALPIGEILK
ncbi:hypothetical protein [Curvibacter gracilis]|uniref:hypothetical protein n=1 Tax=Curvibacter gracilis TaxID=230310 RepID=UPI00146FB826|nr:hypothetical protein [Curvibacter gracilis]